ncbi:MAG: protein phosphatase CheZ [Chromatiales bacterium]|nr:protein phosphatase CheZ [Chromatiales bacterium]
MEQEKIESADKYGEQLNELAKKIEQGQTESAEKILDEITRWREDSLFQDLGKLTREFHEALQNFRIDSRITNIAEEDFPDARERLNYVLTMTAQSADRSLTATESAMPICHSIKERNSALKEQWGRFSNRELNLDEFRVLHKEMGKFFDGLDEDVPALEANLNEITMAQDFQDLTGQIIGRVITLVDDVESSLVNLIRLSGQHILSEKSDGPAEKERDIESQGPMVPGVDDEAAMVSGQDEVDDLLSSLGF